MYERIMELPREIEAIQYIVMNKKEVIQFVGSLLMDHTENCLSVQSKYGIVPVTYGCYVARDGQEIIVFPKEEFERRFRRATF